MHAEPSGDRIQLPASVPRLTRRTPILNPCASITIKTEEEQAQGSHDGGIPLKFYSLPWGVQSIRFAANTSLHSHN